MLQSPNPLYRQLGEMAYVPLTEDEQEKMQWEEVARDNTHVYLTSGLGEGFYASKEVIEGTIPFGGFIINKKWIMHEELVKHMLIYQQVILFSFWKIQLQALQVCVSICHLS